jgi:ATP-dependent DNA helicase RecG
MIEVGLARPAWLDRSINKGDQLLLSGPVRFYHGRQLARASSSTSAPIPTRPRRAACWRCTAPLRAELQAHPQLIEKHLDGFLPLVKEYLPAALLAEADVPALPEALRALHRPTRWPRRCSARARLAYEELLFVHLLQRVRTSWPRDARRHPLRQQAATHLALP